MAKLYTLQAESRDGAGKGASRALRRDGKIPAVIYGDGKEPVKITLPLNETNVEYNKAHMFTTLCDLDLDGTKHKVLARDVQLHPVTDIVQHVDFLRVNNKTKIAVSVPVQFTGEEESPSLKEKGTLNVVRHEVELVCSAMAIPDFIEVNLAGKEHGDSVKISDATLPEGTKPVIDDRDFTIATLIAPKVASDDEDEAAEGGEGEAAEGEGGEESAAEGEASDE